MQITKKLFNVSAILALLIGLNSVAGAREPQIPYNSITGTYEIFESAELEELEYCVSGAGVSQSPAWTSAGKVFILMNNIEGFCTPIGTHESPFKGTFDGNGKKITLSINSTDITEGTGAFGYTYGATIKNLVVDGEINYYSIFTFGVWLGGIVGFGRSTTITNCTNLADITTINTGAIGVGGIAGVLQTGAITSCANAGNVTIEGYNFIGGIVGSVRDGGTISNCINIGTIKAGTQVGGIVGAFSSLGDITNCANAGWVSGDSYVGGIVGYVFNLGNMQNCLNTGVTQGNSDVHSLIGCKSNNCSLSGKISKCYYDNQVSIYTGVYGMTNSVAGVQGLSTNELTRPEIKNSLGSAWNIYHNMNSQIYSYPFVNASSNNSNISSLAAMPARLSNNECWNNVSSVITLDKEYVKTIWIESWPGGPLYQFYQTEGMCNWRTEGVLAFPPPPDPSLPQAIPIGGTCQITAHNPSPGYSSLSSLIAYKSDSNGNTYQKVIPIVPSGVPFKIPVNNYATYGFEASEVTPNIVTNNAVIDINTATEGNLNVAIFDVSGSEVIHVTNKHVTAQSQAQVELNNLHNLPTGSYMVAVSIGNNVIFKKFIKQ